MANLNKIFDEIKTVMDTNAKGFVYEAECDVDKNGIIKINIMLKPSIQHIDITFNIGKNEND